MNLPHYSVRPPLWYASRCCLRRSSSLALTMGRCASRKSSAWRGVNCVCRGHRYARTLQHALSAAQALGWPPQPEMCNALQLLVGGKPSLSGCMQAPACRPAQ